MTQNFDAHPGEPVTLSKLRAGTSVGGYRLLRRLGAGGMGVVWEATDEGGRHVAMKILHPQIAADPTARRRLDREASVLARVRDTRVARILDIETGDGSQGITFVITELIEGPTLQHEVEHEGVYDLTTDARDLADLAHGLVDSLRAVHAAGVIHRDLKPSNVMLGAQGPVLIDFGIAQVADDVRLTQTGQVTGTPGFIPPEMLDGGEPNADVDWYACAGVLLFTVTGLAPFGSGAWQVVFRRVYGGTPELGNLEQECPALARAFTAALAPEAENRLSPDGLLEVLDEIAEGGTGQEAVDRLLGPEDEEPEFSELERSTSTFTPGYGSTPGSPRDARSATSASPAAYGSPVSAPSGAEGGLLGAVGRLRRFHPAPTGHPASPVVPEQFGDALTGGAVDAVRRGRSCTCGRLGGVPAAGTVGAGADVPLFGSASDGVSARLFPGRRRSDGCAIGGQRSQTSGGAAPVGAGAGASPDSDAGPVVHAVRGRDLQTGLDGDHRGDSDGGSRRCGPGPGRSALEPASAGRYLAVGRLPHVGHDPVVPGAFGDLCWLRFSSGLRDCVPLPHGYFLIGSGAGKIRDFWIDPATCSFLHHLPLGGRPGPSHPVAGAMGCGDTTRWRTYPQFRRPQ